MNPHQIPAGRVPMYGEHHRREWTLLSCHRCGALVLPEHVDRHNAWHAMLGSAIDKLFDLTAPRS